MSRTTRVIATLFAGLLLVFFNSCGKMLATKSGITIMGNPLTQLSVATYQSQSLQSLNVCMGQLLLTPTAGLSTVAVNFNTLQEVAVSADGVDLQALEIPLGEYSRIEVVLSNACGTQRSIGIVNAQGTFDSSQNVSLVFTGQVTIDSVQKKLTFQIQPIVNNLGQATSNSDVPTQAAASPGSVTMADIWNTGPTLANAPSPRDHAMSVWTGTQMLTWGGRNANWLGDGGRYTPSADTWTTMSATGAPTPRWESAYVWTGTSMLIWSGQTLGTDGYIYNPATDTWSGMSANQAPTGRHSPAFVWTGTEMIVWGGTDGSAAQNTGGRYNPATDTWAALPTTGAPPAAAFEDHNVAAVWTGTEMLVWGGNAEAPIGYVNTGGRYNPTTDSWSAIPTTGAPSPRKNFTPVWTGTEMIVWGGNNGNCYNDGARYNPTTNTWTAMSMTNAPSPRDTYGAVWTGSKMIIWGGNDNTSDLADGYEYDPATDTWATISGYNAPSARWGPTALWTGTNMLVWSGSTGSNAPFFNDGGFFTP